MVLDTHIILLDRERHLRYDCNAMADLETIYNLSIHQILSIDAGIIFTRAALWAGLKHEDPKLSLKQTGELIDQWMERNPEKRFEELLLLVISALVDAGWIKVKKPDDPNPNPPQTGG